MKKFLAVMLVLALCAPAVFANGIGGYASYWDTDDADDGYGFGAKLQLGLFPNVELEARGTLFRDFGDEDTELDMLVVEAGAIILIPTGSSVSPYLGGGIGYFSFDPEGKGDLDEFDIEIDDEFGYYGVVGMEVGAGNFAFFVEGKYTILEATAEAESAGITIEEDGDLDGFGGTAGILIKW